LLKYEYSDIWLGTPATVATDTYGDDDDDTGMMCEYRSSSGGGGVKLFFVTQQPPIPMVMTTMIQG
jgi:hypothetical protein